ncbi:MAG TPA: hypothetical protein VMN60_05910 [Longimicrobiales bacterium]|nr:hypothetical protein [Longimicrobiales bacterium]
MAATRQLRAWLNLAWHFARHLLVQVPARALGGARDAARFRAAVLPEGYVPLLPAERALMPAAMRCINCGLCALACDSLAQQPASAWAEAWTFAAGLSRSIDRAPVVVAQPSPCSADPLAAAVCPAGVPIPELQAMITRLANHS